MARPHLRLTGRTFGKLTALEYVGRSSWMCSCECGGEVVRKTNLLLSGLYLHCGCARRSIATHGMSHTSTHWIWSNMVSRCTRPNAPNWKYYGGRGITTCDRWRTSFSAFLEDMGVRPVGYTLDRIDNDGPYSRANCRWVTRETQMNNTRANRRITHGGRTQTITQWARERGVPVWRLRRRITAGWAMERALADCSCSARARDA